MICCRFYKRWMEICLDGYLEHKYGWELMSCVTSLTDGGCQVISITEQFHFTNMPVFWQDTIIRTDVFECTQKVYQLQELVQERGLVTCVVFL